MFLCCGEALADLFAAGGGLDLRASLGGSPLNVAIGLARLGCAAGFLGTLSRDFLGEAILAALAAEGVETSLLTRTDAPTPLALVGLARDGVPTYGFHGLRDGAAPDLPDCLPEAVRVLHVGSVGAALGASGAALTALARRERGARLISYDPNVRPAVEPDPEVWRRRVGELTGCADMVKVSQEDLDFLAPEASVPDVAARWLAGGTRLVVVTQGALGAVAFTRHETAHVPAREVAVADTVGAGDSFQAALLAACAGREALTAPGLDTLSAPELCCIVSFAVEAAAVTCGRAGADLPRRAEVHP